MQAMIEFVNSNSVIAEQQYKHRLKYKWKHLIFTIKNRMLPCMYFENIWPAVV